MSLSNYKARLFDQLMICAWEMDISVQQSVDYCLFLYQSSFIIPHGLCMSVRLLMPCMWEYIIKYIIVGIDTKIGFQFFVPCTLCYRASVLLFAYMYSSLIGEDCWSCLSSELHHILNYPLCLFPSYLSHVYYVLTKIILVCVSSICIL